MKRGIDIELLSGERPGIRLPAQPADGRGAAGLVEARLKAIIDTPLSVITWLV